MAGGRVFEINFLENVKIPPYAPPPPPPPPYLVKYLPNQTQFTSVLTFVQGRSSRPSTNTSSPHFTSWFRQAKKLRKLAYDPDQEISLVQAVSKQRANLSKYDKLLLHHFSCTRAKMAEWNHTRRDHREVAGKWGKKGRGGEGMEKRYVCKAVNVLKIALITYKQILRITRSPSLSCTLLHLNALSFTWAHYPSLVCTLLHLYALSFTCTHSPSLVCTFLHLYALSLTCMHSPSLYALSFTCTHSPSLVRTPLHLYALSCTCTSLRGA